MYSAYISIKKMRHYAHSKTYQKAISLLLVICFFVIPLSVVTFPKKTEAVCAPGHVPPTPDPTSVPVHDSAASVTKQADQFMKGNIFFTDCILDGLATLIAKTIIKQLTNSIVNWINSGFKGNPSFVGNVGNFMGGIADKVGGKTIESIAPFLCSPFKLEIQLALATAQSNGSADLSCTLSDAENNFNDFINGGTGNSWDNWLQITQIPQNNPFGAMLIAKSKVTTNVAAAQSKYQQQLDWGKGFLSFEDCSTQTGEQAAVSSLGYNPYATSAYNSTASKNKYAVNSEVNSQTKTVNSSLASIGSLDLFGAAAGTVTVRNLDGTYTTTNSNGTRTTAPEVVNLYTGELYNKNGTLAPKNTPGGVYYTAVKNGVGINPITYEPYAEQDNSSSYNLWSGLSMGSSNDLHFNTANPNDKQVYDANNQPVYGVQAGENGCVTKTPGAVVESQLENFLGSDLRGLELAQSIDQIVAALVGQLVNQALGGIGGLLGAGGGGGSGGGGSSSGSPSAYQNSVNSKLGAAGATIPTLPIMGYCTANVQSTKIGSPVTWSAYIPEINGAVTYSWSGDENLIGSSSAVTTTYTTNGTKNASVTITTTGATPQTTTIDCDPGITVGNASVSGSGTPTISCAASLSNTTINTPVTWQAVVIGGVSPFTYAWQGTDMTGSDLGQRAVKSYSTPGIKTATVYVTSADGNTYSNTCSSVVNVTQ